jgi:tRNA (guanosine-2'-O-)-methyltransferase
MQAVLARRQPDLTVVADDVHKPHNIAALLRTCDAVGVLGIHAVGPRSTFVRPRGTSGGTSPRVGVRAWRSLAPALAHLKAEGFQIVAAHLSGMADDYRDVDYTRPTALLLGSELRGVSAEGAALADRHASLPMRGLASSLNVSVAAALFLYEAARQREAAGLYAQCRVPPEVRERTLFEWCHPGIAARCRARRVPYPPLTTDGDLAANPFGESGAGAQVPAGIPGT